MVLFLTGCVTNTLSAGEGAYAKRSSVSYGPHANQKFKTYLPTNVTSSTPVVIFVPGGGWIRSDRRKYSFVGKALARQGFITAIPGYRVYPDVAFPGFVQDVASAFADIKKSYAPDRPVFLLGHSAGAHIAAMLTYDNSYLAAHGLNPCRDIAGFVGLAGPYDYNPRVNSRHERIFPQSARGRHMPMAFASAKAPPVLLLHGTSDRIVPVNQSRRFHAKLKSLGSSARLRIYKGVGHVAILGAYSSVLPTKATTVKDVAAFIRSSAKSGGNTCR